MRVAAIILFYAFISATSPNAMEFGYHAGNNKSERAEKNFFIKVFGGLIAIPPGFYFEASSIKSSHVRFSNLTGFEAGSPRNFFAVVRAGLLDDETRALIDSSDRVMSCYGFSQAIKDIESKSGIVVSTVFFDESTYVSFMSDNPELWINALDVFMRINDDLEGACLYENE
jgi:hypothetical protein